MRGVPPSERRTQADSVLAALGLADFRDRFVAELSGGMAQRAALGRALIYDPKVLLLDEPFGALDALTREALQLDLLRLWGQTGKTIILVTHSITEAAFMADRVAVLSARPGRLRAVVPIPLPRPRQHAMIHSEEFGILVAQIRANIEAGGNVANQ
jgi:NitT/TauT family transport system ATP-binding protein